MLATTNSFMVGGIDAIPVEVSVATDTGTAGITGLPDESVRRLE